MNKSMDKFLVVGANFVNKGAQSMLFTTVCEIKKRKPNAVVYYASDENFDSDLYKFEQIYYSEPAKYIALGIAHGVKNQVYNIGVECVNTILMKRKVNLRRMFELRKILPSIDLMIDISGFNLGEKWSESIQIRYLNNIRIAKKYDIPIILLPQSFGPFNYSKKKSYLLKEIAECLDYPDVIYAREKDGYNALINTFHLTNVKLSSDLVLQSKGVDWKLLYNKIEDFTLPELQRDAVAVIPNNQCFVHGDTTRICHYYRIMIDELLAEGKQIYIFRHSTEDLCRCYTIYEMYKSDKNVHLLENDFSCIEYDEFIKNFQFIICSRFHGIVHAYRNGIPAIVIGWAVKYKELTKSTSQSQYMLDITEENIEDNRIKEIVGNMLSNYVRESEIIREKVEEIQQDSCFEVLSNYIS